MPGQTFPDTSGSQTYEGYYKYYNDYYYYYYNYYYQAYYDYYNQSGGSGFDQPGGTPFIGTTDGGGQVQIPDPTWTGNSILTGGQSGCIFSDPYLITGPGPGTGTFPTVVMLPPCPEYCATIDWGDGTSPQVFKEPDLWLTTQPLALGVFQTQAGSPSGDMSSQWAFKKLGLPLSLPKDKLAPVIVAVIDSGLDIKHPYIKPENIWVNHGINDDPDFPDDLIGWNFSANNNNVWDDNGHGTFVAGIILAVNPAARIMPLKAMNRFGAGPSSAMSSAIIYAVDHGAQVINLSVGAKGLSQIQQAVVDYARRHGVLIVAAAGNEGVDTAGYGPAGLTGVLTVAATDQNDKKPPFGNWGQQVALAAPGVDIVSLRARWTDFVLVATAGKDYKPGENIVQSDKWLFRATGTSFAAPFVTGAASLLMSLNPNLTGRQAERMLVGTADDIESPGWDQFTGTGRLNIARAMQADPNAYLVAKVSHLEGAQERGQAVVKVSGTADGNRMASYQIQLGQGESPSSWKTVAAEKGKSVDGGVLASFSAREITARGKWTVRLLVEDSTGRTKEARGSLDVK